MLRCFYSRGFYRLLCRRPAKLGRRRTDKPHRNAGIGFRRVRFYRYVRLFRRDVIFQRRGFNQQTLRLAGCIRFLHNSLYHSRCAYFHHLEKGSSRSFKVSKVFSTNKAPVKNGGFLRHIGRAKKGGKPLAKKEFIF